MELLSHLIGVNRVVVFSGKHLSHRHRHTVHHDSDDKGVYDHHGNITSEWVS